MKTVLLVDDDRFHLEVTSDLLQKLGAMHIEMAPSCADARLILAKGISPDLILLDLNMPNIDGVEFLEELKQREVRAALLLVTAAGESVRRGASTLAQVYGLNLAGVVEKPVTLNKLVCVLAHV